MLPRYARQDRQRAKRLVWIGALVLLLVCLGFGWRIVYDHQLGLASHRGAKIH